MEPLDGIAASGLTASTIKSGDTGMPDSSERRTAEDIDTCRICRGEESEEEPLFYPCKCSGSIKFVHQTCLMEWLSHSQKKYCELCKTHFRFTKLYSSHMPQSLPIPIFLRQLVVHILANLVTWSRIILVTAVWLGWLPWSIRHVWRAMFFLVDGRWVPISRIREQKTFSPVLGIPTGSRLLNSSSAVANLTQLTFGNGQNDTRTFFTSPPVFSEFLLVKLVKIFFPMAYHWTVKNSVESNGTDAQVNHTATVTTTTQKSLLSDVKCLQNLSSNPRINRILIDTLEGQLICLSIVAAFILVFLIREWVINQQPVVDIANEEGHRDAARPIEHDRAGAPGERGRHQPAILPAIEGRPIAMPRRRRHMFHPTNADNMPGSDRQIGTLGSAAAAHSQLESGIENSGQSSPQSETDRETRQDAILTPYSGRPSLIARNADRAAVIQRGLEERSPGAPIHEWPGLDTFKDLWERGESDPSQVLQLIDQEGRRGELGWIVSHMENLQRTSTASRHSEERPQDSQKDAGGSPLDISTLPPLFNPSKAHLQPTTNPVNTNQTQDLAEVRKRTSQAHVTPFQGRSSAESNPTAVKTDGFVAGTASKASEPQQTRSSVSNDTFESNQKKGSVLSDQPNQVESKELGIEAPSNIVRNETETQSHQPNDEESERNPENGIRDLPQNAPPLFERVAVLLWGNPNEFQRIDDAQDEEDDEHIVEDIAQEPPFVPVAAGQQSREQHGLQEDSDHDYVDEDDDNNDDTDSVEAHAEDQNNHQDPEVVAAAAEAGVDLNNADAIEEAEDLDGIIDLVGLRGPLSGLVQNVIFSEFLLAFIIASCIWLPYIWGKITAILLANPITCFVKAPLQLASAVADTLLDICMWLVGNCVRVLEVLWTSLAGLTTYVFPALKGKIYLPLFRGKPLSFAIGASSQSRLGKTVSAAIFDMTPDMPLFSACSHAALNLLKSRLETVVRFVVRLILVSSYELPLQLHNRIYGIEASPTFDIISDLKYSLAEVSKDLAVFVPSARAVTNDLLHLRIRIHMSEAREPVDYSLAIWSTQDRILATSLGYAFFAFLGYLYLRFGRLFYGVPQGEKLNGTVADTLRQAGGVLKVVLIIGIEMILFPLYCGLLLDAAMLPAFAGVGLKSRVSFVMRSPMTGLFVHWFVGTCYMFHFALFVSMCRKILRKGCLYFIRDPDDPNFHPVRDVLERPIITQLSKIAQSALVYGGLVIICLGVVVWVVSNIGSFLPFHYSLDQPLLEIPLDLLYFNFALPFLARKIEISEHITSIYSWWFHKSAQWLRLTDFLFGERREAEEGSHVRTTWWAVLAGVKGDIKNPFGADGGRISSEGKETPAFFIRDGRFVRAPASDSVRIPRGQRVFLEVNEDNERVDGEPDPDSGPHGKRNKNFTKVYVPPRFRLRITTFVVSLWIFAAFTTGAAILLPLSVGRNLLKVLLPSSGPVNDLYALALGANLCAVSLRAMIYIPRLVARSISLFKGYRLPFSQLLFHLRPAIIYCLGLTYLATALTFVLPLLLSLTFELYFVLPVQTYLTSNIQKYPNFPNLTQGRSVPPPTVHLIQIWTLGLLYTRCLYYTATHYPSPTSRVASAVKAITRDGILRPNVALATRAFILPAMVACTFLLLAPLPLAYLLKGSSPGFLADQSHNVQAKITCYAYPALLGLGVAGYCSVLLKRALQRWRMRIRDEVYLIGERLHNFGDMKTYTKGRPGVDRANSVLARIDVGPVG